MRRYSVLEWIALVLIIVGAINWGLVGLFGFNLVEAIFQSGSLITNLIYVLVGIAGLYELVMLVKPDKDRVTKDGYERRG